MMAVRQSAVRLNRSRVTVSDLSRGHPAVLLGMSIGTLVVLGLIMILSASSVSSFANYGSSFLFFKKQALWAAIGIAAFIVFARLDYRRLVGVGYVMIVGVALLL